MLMFDFSLEGYEFFFFDSEKSNEKLSKLFIENKENIKLFRSKGSKGIPDYYYDKDDGRRVYIEFKSFEDGFISLIWFINELCYL